LISLLADHVSAVARAEYALCRWTTASQLSHILRPSSDQPVLQLAVTDAMSVQGVANGTLTVGDTILFLSLLSQLYAPLNYFGVRLS